MLGMTPDDELRDMARTWLKEHCFPESFAVFGETWAEPLASLLAAAEQRGAERMREACAKAAEKILTDVHGPRPAAEAARITAAHLADRIRALSTAGRSKT